MPESQVTTTPIPGTPSSSRKQPYVSGMEFVPQKTHTSSIPARFEGQVPLTLPVNAFIPSFMSR